MAKTAVVPDLAQPTQAQLNRSAALAAQQILRLVGARSSIATFVDAIGFGMQPAKHHLMMIAELERLERGDTQALMLFLPPGAAKSTYGNFLFSAWYMGRNPGNNVLTISHTGDLAERFGRRVRNMVGSAPFHRIFPEVSVASDLSAMGRWETNLGGEYFAAGIHGNIAGRRADLGMIDDPVASREKAESQTEREKAWDWYVGDFEPRLKPNAKRVLIMTRWHEDDLAGRILARDGSLWRVVKLPMEAGEDDPLGRAAGEQLWPEWFTPGMVANAKKDPRIWTSLYQQDPRPATGGEFKRGWMQYYSSVSPRGMNIVLLVDPAGSKTTQNDYTAIWVVGLGDDENYYILDMIRDRLNLTERAEACFRLHRKWKPMQVRYERYGMMGDIEFLRHEMDRRNYRFAIVEVAGQTSKEDRIRRLVPLFQHGRMWFPSELSYTTNEGVVVDLVKQFVEEEMLAFPVGRHDDMLDGLARISEPKIDTPWPRKRDTSMTPVLSFGMLDPTTGY